jgi:hypothetical protein
LFFNPANMLGSNLNKEPDSSWLISGSAKIETVVKAEVLFPFFKEPITMTYSVELYSIIPKS